MRKIDYDTEKYIREIYIGKPIDESIETGGKAKKNVPYNESN